MDNLKLMVNYLEGISKNADAKGETDTSFDIKIASMALNKIVDVLAMGCSFFGSSSSYEEPKVIIKEAVKNVLLPNPNPANYSVVRSEVLNKHLIIELKYHDCTNYEGRKIMVYKCTLDDLMKQKLIDPHFCDNENYFSPIARFEPTSQGWSNACVLANCL